MKMKWIIICCCSVLLVGGGILAFVNQSSQDSSDVMQFAVFPTGTSDETYYFTLNQEGTLKCAVGERKGDDIKQNNFLKKIVNSSEKLLSSTDMQILIDLSNELEVSGYDSKKPIVDDSWDVALIYNGKVYEMNLHVSDSEMFKKLVDKIIELSPIPVDLHGWA